MLPWDDPIPLTRAWCLWELFSAATCENVVLEVKLPEEEKPRFRQGLMKSMNAVMNTLVKVQVQRAEAFNPEDQKNIFAAIEGSCGFDHLNKTVKDQLRSWLLNTKRPIHQEKQ